MEWFRFYHDAVDDPKVQRLSPQLFKHWINILCLSSRNSERGSVPSCSDLAFGLRVSEGKVAAIIGSLMDAGLIDRTGETLRIHAWESRQKRSDNVAERVAKYRAGNEPVTLHETLPHVRVTETEQNRDRTEAEQIPPPAPLGGRAPAKPKPKLSVKTAIPDGLLWDVIPGDVRVLIGDEQSMSPDELEAETAKMVDYYRSKGERRADWVATWRNWMRSDFRKPRGSPSAPKDRPTQNGRVGYTIDELKRLANGEQVESPGNNATTHDARFRVVQ